MNKLLTIFGDAETNAVEQINNCLADERAVAGALMADNHLGYAMPIGGVIAYKDAISPSGVGFDIACGNMCVRTDFHLHDLAPNAESIPGGRIWDTEADLRINSIKPIMRTIQKNISFGMGRSNPEPIDHELFNSPVWDEIDTEPGQPLKQKAAAQLGTVGSGNHYVDLLVGDDARVWVANHFGSRGFGHAVASGFLAIAAGKNFTDRVKETDVPAVLDIGTPAGDLYVEAMKLAGRYAYAGREYVIDQVLTILGATSDFEVHNHHNFAWEEDGYWVVRKGATPLTGDPAFIGGSMGDISVIVRGKSPSNKDEITPWEIMDIGALGSAPHGAGRIMSRTAAAGKLRKMWVCNNRNCDFQEHSTGDNTSYEKNRCPKCELPLRKLRLRDTSDAKIDWPETLRELGDRGITVLGSGADEAPGVYKDLSTVLAAHSNIEILHSLTPIGVVMAGPDTKDPYRD